jgi:hypothetical protein
VRTVSARGAPAPLVRVLVWNIEWKPVTGFAGRTMRSIVEGAAPDVVCITEGHESFLTGRGHVIASDPDYGYPLRAGRRKVLLWSRRPWTHVDPMGHPCLPPGRFIAGRTGTPTGPVTVLGVCIPYRHAHVSTGRRDRRPWEDHRVYLDGLATILCRFAGSGPMILVGDFNQFIPRRTAPADVFGELMAALGELHVVTAGNIPGIDCPVVDHVGHSGDLSPHGVYGLPNLHEGHRLSDHFGLVVDFSRAGPE